MQHCDTFLGTLFLSPHTERQRPSQRWFRMRPAWWISLLSLLIDHWVTQAAASPNKPTPAFLMTQGTCIVAVLCLACKQWHYKELCLCPSNLVLLILSSHKDRRSFLSLLSPCFPQEGHFCVRESLHCMQDKHFSLTFFQRVQILKKFWSWPVRVIRLWL